MPFLQSTLMEEIKPNPEFLSTKAQIHNTFNQNGIAKKIKKKWQKMITTTKKKNYKGSTIPSTLWFLIAFTTKLHLHSLLVFPSTIDIVKTLGWTLSDKQPVKADLKAETRKIILGIKTR